MHCGGRGAVHRCDKASYVNMHFIHSTENEVYACPLASNVGVNLSLTADAPVTHSLNYADFTRIYVTLHSLTIFDY